VSSLLQSHPRILCAPRQLLAKFEDYSDSAFISYHRLPAIPDRSGKLPGQKRPKRLVVHLPQLDPIRFPKLHNPEVNGLALDPTVEPKHRLAMAVVDDDEEEKTVSQKLAAALRENSARVLDLFRQSAAGARTCAVSAQLRRVRSLRAFNLSFRSG